MKRRIGFVSNSSSASYCILGFDVSELEYDEVYNTAIGLTLLNGDLDGLEEGQIVVGETLLWVSNDGDVADTKSYSVPLDTSKIEAMRKHFGINTPIKLYFGTAAC